MTEDKSYLKYYNYLSRTFGRVDCTGCLQLAHILDMFQLGDRLMDVYSKYAEEISSTPVAVERNLRTYISVIMRDLTMEDISRIFNYEFRPDQTRVTLSEFVPVAKMFIDSLED